MSAREWWPADWADEDMPPARDKPDAFIVEADGSYWLGYALDAADASDHDKRYFNKEIDSGDIIDFVCCDDLGAIELTINPDGSFSVDGDVPSRATHFWASGDPETLSSSLSDFVENWISLDPPDEPELIIVAMAWWSDPLPHKFIVGYDDTFRLKPRFEQVSAAEATHAVS